MSSERSRNGKQEATRRASLLSNTSESRTSERIKSLLQVITNSPNVLTEGDQNKDDSSLPPGSPIIPKQRTYLNIESVDVSIQNTHLTREDVIIVVMGPTGAGKSTFIQTATGHTDGVGHGLESCTSDVSAVRMNFPDGRDVVLVDTPGFDDTKLSDLEVLNIIAKWLKDARQDSLELSGILYLHRISDNRMAGTPLKNLGMFKKLCGDTFFERVILTTTMWPEIGDELKACESRERELRKEYWVDMIGRGSTTMRFENTPETAWNILNSIIDAEFGRRFDSAVLKIQEELVDQGKKLPKTEAGIQLHGFIEELVEKQNDILRRLREELGQAGDAVVVEALLTDLGQLRKQREQAMKDMRQLNPTLLGKLRRIFTLPPRARSSKPTVPLKSPGPASTNPGEQHGQTRSSESWDMPDTDGKPLPAGPSGAPGDQSPSMVDVVDNRNSRPPLDTPPETVSS